MADAFARWLKGQRQARGLSMNALARKAGLRSHVHVSMLESDRANPSRAMVLKLAGALGLGAAATDEGLAAAGFAPQGAPTGALRYVTDPDAALIVEAYEGGTQNEREVLRELAARLREHQRARGIGGGAPEDNTDAGGGQ